MPGPFTKDDLFLQIRPDPGAAVFTAHLSEAVSITRLWRPA